MQAKEVRLTVTREETSQWSTGFLEVSRHSWNQKTISIMQHHTENMYKNTFKLKHVYLIATFEKNMILPGTNSGAVYLSPEMGKIPANFSTFFLTPLFVQRS